MSPTTDTPPTLAASLPPQCPPAGAFSSSTVTAGSPAA